MRSKGTDEEVEKWKISGGGGVDVSVAGREKHGKHRENDWWGLNERVLRLT